MWLVNSNKKIDTLKDIHSIIKEIPSIENIIIIPYANDKILIKNFEYTNWNEILNSQHKFEKFEKFEKG